MGHVEVALSRVAEDLGAEYVKTDGKGEKIFRCFRASGHTNADENPSLHVNDEEGAFKCWGCGIEGRSAATLVMLANDGMTTGDAAKWLRERYGDGVPGGAGEDEPRRSSRRSKKSLPPLTSKPGTAEEWAAARAALAGDADARRMWGARSIRIEWMLRAGVAIGHYGGEKTVATAMWLWDFDKRCWSMSGTMHRRITMNTNGNPWVARTKRKGETIAKEKKSLCNQGGHLGLFIRAADTLDQAIGKGSTIHVFEGGPDWFCGLGAGLDAVGLPCWVSNVRGEIAKSLRELLHEKTDIVLCPQNDPEGQSQRGMKNLAEILKPERCRVLWPSRGAGKDFADAIAAGHRDPFRSEKTAGVDSLGLLVGGTQLSALSERAVRVDEDAQALMIRMNRGEIKIANFNIRVASELIRTGVNPWDPTVAEVEVEVIPLSGMRRGKYLPLGALPPAVWLDSRRTLERIMSMYPSAQVGDTWGQVWNSVRGFAQTQCPDDRRGRLVCSRCGWHEGDRYVMPSGTIGPKGDVIARGETEARWVLEHDLRPAVAEAESVLALVRAVDDLSRMSNDEHANAVLMGLHLASALASRLSKMMIARPSVFLASVHKTGKSWLARAHLLPWVPGTVIGDNAGPGEISLESSTPKAAHEALSTLWDTVCLIDNWNPTAMTKNKDEWVRLFHALFDSATIRRLNVRAERRDTASTGASLIVTGEEMPHDVGAESRFIPVSFSVSPWNDETLSPKERTEAAIDGESRCRRVQCSSDTLLSLIPSCLKSLCLQHGSFEAVDKYAGEMANLWGQRLMDTAAGRATRLVTAVAVGLTLMGEAMDHLLERVSPQVPERSALRERFLTLEEALAAWFANQMRTENRHSEWSPDMLFIRALDALVMADEIGCHGVNTKKPSIMRWDESDKTYRKGGGGTMSIQWSTCWQKATQALQRTSTPLRASQAAVRQMLKQRGHLIAPNIARALPMENRRLNMTVLSDEIFECVGDYTEDGDNPNQGRLSL